MSPRTRKYLKRALAIVILLAGSVWTADWLLLRRRIARDDQAFGEVEMHYRYAVHLKNRRIEQRIEKPQMEECVNSIFPHYNETPCWYLERHPDQTKTLDGGPWHFFYDE